MADDDGYNNAASAQPKGKSFHPFEHWELYKGALDAWTADWLRHEANNGFKQCKSKDGKRLSCSCFRLLIDCPSSADGVS